MKKDQIEIKDISTEGLDAVLKFIYTNNIHITRNNIQDSVHQFLWAHLSPKITLNPGPRIYYTPQRYYKLSL